MKALILGLFLIASLFCQASEYSEAEDLRRAAERLDAINKDRLATEKRIYDQDHPRSSNSAGSSDTIFTLSLLVIGFVAIILTQVKLPRFKLWDGLPPLPYTAEYNCILFLAGFIVLMVLILSYRMWFE